MFKLNKRKDDQIRRVIVLCGTTWYPKADLKLIFKVQLSINGSSLHCTVRNKRHNVSEDRQQQQLSLCKILKTAQIFGIKPLEIKVLWQ